MPFSVTHLSILTTHAYNQAPCLAHACPLSALVYRCNRFNGPALMVLALLNFADQPQVRAALLIGVDYDCSN
jgi:hypothetical protein